MDRCKSDDRAVYRYVFACPGEAEVLVSAFPKSPSDRPFEVLVQAQRDIPAHYCFDNDPPYPRLVSH